jgi:hypothetical protein
MKFNLTSISYWAPTPKSIRKIADSILAASVTIASFAAFSEHTKLATAVMIVAALAKFTSNFFTDEPTV